MDLILFFFTKTPRIYDSKVFRGYCSSCSKSLGNNFQKLEILKRERLLLLVVSSCES